MRYYCGNFPARTEENQEKSCPLQAFWRSRLEPGTSMSAINSTATFEPVGQNAGKYQSSYSPFFKATTYTNIINLLTISVSLSFTAQMSTLKLKRR